MNDALGIFEINALTPAMVALDAMEKAADVCVKHVELNDLAGVCAQITGATAAVEAAIAAGRDAAERMRMACLGHVIPRPSGAAVPFIDAKPEYTPLMEADIVWFPRDRTRHGDKTTDKESNVADEKNFALGFIETQGYTAVFEAIDTACKAANVEVVGKEKLGGGFITVVIKGDVAAVKAAIVEVVGKEKLGGGYITVVIKGDVAAVKAAVDSGSAKVNGLGKLIAAHVIARPSDSVMKLMSKL